MKKVVAATAAAVATATGALPEVRATNEGSGGVVTNDTRPNIIWIMAGTATLLVVVPVIC